MVIARCLRRSGADASVGRCPRGMDILFGNVVAGSLKTRKRVRHGSDVHAAGPFLEGSWRSGVDENPSLPRAKGIQSPHTDTLAVGHSGRSLHG